MAALELYDDESLDTITFDRDPPWPNQLDIIGLKNFVGIPSQSALETKKVFRYFPARPGKKLIRKSDPNSVYLKVDIMFYGEQLMISP